MIKKKNESFYIKVNTIRDVYNKPEIFSCEVINDATSEKQVYSNFSEIILTHNNRSAEVNGSIIDSKIIPVQNNTLLSGDVFVSNGIYYYIKYSSLTEIHLYNSSVNPISGVLNEVGNTGIYKQLLNINEIGQYTIVINNSEKGSSKILSLSIIEEDITDANTKINQIRVTLDELSDSRDYVAFA